MRFYDIVCVQCDGSLQFWYRMAPSDVDRTGAIYAHRCLMFPVARIEKYNAFTTDFGLTS